MIGVYRQVNPGLRLAGDSVRRSNLDCLDNLCRGFPDNRFLVTTLAREDQHELCVTARKHPNLLVFGCWWFLNNPSVIQEITRERLEMLGLTVVPQHSDARVLDPDSEASQLGEVPVSRCTFKRSADQVDVLLTVYTYTSRDDARKSFERSRLRAADSEPVKGLGDGAYWWTVSVPANSSRSLRIRYRVD